MFFVIFFYCFTALWRCQYHLPSHYYWNQFVRFSCIPSKVIHAVGKKIFEVPAFLVRNSQQLSSSLLRSVILLALSIFNFVRIEIQYRFCFVQKKLGEKLENGCCHAPWVLFKHENKIASYLQGDDLFGTFPKFSEKQPLLLTRTCVYRDKKC